MTECVWSNRGHTHPGSLQVVSHAQAIFKDRRYRGWVYVTYSKIRQRRETVSTQKLHVNCMKIVQSAIESLELSAGVQFERYDLQHSGIKV